MENLLSQFLLYLGILGPPTATITIPIIRPMVMTKVNAIPRTINSNLFSAQDNAQYYR